MDDSTAEHLGVLLDRARGSRSQGNQADALAFFEAAAAIDPNDPNIRIEIARELRGLSRLVQSERALRTLLDARPNDLGALVELGYVLRQLGDRHGSLAAFEGASTVDPNHLGVLVEVARDLRDLERLDDAAAILARVLASAPRDLGALIERGHLLRCRGDHGAALAAFEAAAACEPGHLGVKLEVAREMRSLSRLDDATGLLTTVLEGEPRNVGALIELGHVRRQRGDHRGALDVFSRTVDADPRQSGAKLELAREFRALDRSEEAERILAELTASEPANPWPHVERGYVRRRHGDHAGAAASFEAASAANPRHIGIKLELAAECRGMGRLREAETILRDVLSGHPDDAPAAASLAQLMMDTNRLAEAEALLTAARTTTPCDPHIAVSLANVARRRGDGAAALRHLQSASDIDPSNLDITMDLAAEMREQGQFDDAFRLVESVLSKSPEHWAGWIELGLLYRAKDERERAITAFETAIAKRPSHAQGFVELAHEKWALGRPDEANELLQRALEQEPGHLGALIVSAEYALAKEDPEEALRLARRTIELHPGQIGPYILAVRAAAKSHDRRTADLLLDQADRRFGSPHETAAMRIYIQREYRDHDVARPAIETGGFPPTTSFAYSLESTLLAISLGNFARAEEALATAPARSTRELARVQFLHGKLAETRRDYPSAIDKYKDALALEPSNASWHGEIARLSLLQMDLEAASTYLRNSVELERGTRAARGQPYHASQSHVGQLLDEFKMDPGLREGLERIGRLPANQQIEPLKQAVANNPDYTAPALLLALALRRAGLLDGRPAMAAPDGEPKIPKRIVQFWNLDATPTDVAALMSSWRDKNPEFEYVLFSDVSAARFLADRQLFDELRAFRRTKEPARRADLFRLAYLALEGGYFADADDRCLASIGSVVPPGIEMVAYQEDYGTIASDFIGVTPSHPVMVHARQSAVQALNRGDRDVAWLSTGPGLMTRSFASFVATAAKSQGFSNFHIFETWEVQRFVGTHCPLAYKRTRQHWSRAAFHNVARRQ